MNNKIQVFATSNSPYFSIVCQLYHYPAVYEFTMDSMDKTWRIHPGQCQSCGITQRRTFQGFMASLLIALVVYHQYIYLLSHGLSSLAMISGHYKCKTSTVYCFEFIFLRDEFSQNSPLVLQMLLENGDINSWFRLSASASLNIIITRQQPSYWAWYNFLPL